MIALRGPLKVFRAIGHKEESSHHVRASHGPSAHRQNTFPPPRDYFFDRIEKMSINSAVVSEGISSVSVAADNTALGVAATNENAEQLNETVATLGRWSINLKSRTY